MRVTYYIGSYSRIIREPHIEDLVIFSIFPLKRHLTCSWSHFIVPSPRPCSPDCVAGACSTRLALSSSSQLALVETEKLGFGLIWPACSHGRLAPLSFQWIWLQIYTSWTCVENPQLIPQHWGCGGAKCGPTTLYTKYSTPTQELEKCKHCGGGALRTYIEIQPLDSLDWHVQ